MLGLEWRLRVSKREERGGDAARFADDGSDWRGSSAESGAADMAHASVCGGEVRAVVVEDTREWMQSVNGGEGGKGGEVIHADIGRRGGRWEAPPTAVCVRSLRVAGELALRWTAERSLSMRLARASDRQAARCSSGVRSDGHDRSWIWSDGHAMVVCSALPTCHLSCHSNMSSWLCRQLCLWPCGLRLTAVESVDLNRVRFLTAPSRYRRFSWCRPVWVSEFVPSYREEIASSNSATPGSQLLPATPGDAGLEKSSTRLSECSALR